MLVLISFLPLINFLFTLLFDGCVACIDVATTKDGSKKIGTAVGRARAAAKARLQARQGGRMRFGAGGDENLGTFDASNVHLTAQQVRSLKRAQQMERGRNHSGALATSASFGQRLRRMGSYMINLGEAPLSQEGRSLLKSQADGVSPPASPPPPPRPPRPPRSRSPPPPPSQLDDAWA